MFNFLKKKDPKIQQDVVSELNYDPRIDSELVGVTVKNGAVTLTGSVPHFYEKYNAEQAARRVGGVKVVYDELQIDLLDDSERSDDDILQAARNVLKWNYEVPNEVTVEVNDGWITLRGTVVWEYERRAAFNAVCSLMGVCGVSNDIALASSIQLGDIKSRIEDALRRSAETESKNIIVDINGSKVTLSGDVESNAEIEDATLAAWSAPGVMNVENNLKLAA